MPRSLHYSCILSHADAERGHQKATRNLAITNPKPSTRTLKSTERRLCSGVAKQQGQGHEQSSTQAARSDSRALRGESRRERGRGPRRANPSIVEQPRNGNVGETSVGRIDISGPEDLVGNRIESHDGAGLSSHPLNLDPCALYLIANQQPRNHQQRSPMRLCSHPCAHSYELAPGLVHQSKTEKSFLYPKSSTQSLVPYTLHLTPVRLNSPGWRSLLRSLWRV